MARPKRADVSKFSAWFSINPHDGDISGLLEAEYFLHSGNDNLAEISLAKARHEASLTEHTNILIRAEFLLGRIALLRGDADAFAAALANMAKLSERYPQKSNKLEADMARSFLMSLLERPGDMAPWLSNEAPRLLHDRLFMPSVPFASLCRSRYLLLTGKPEAMLDEYASMVATEEPVCRLTLIYGYVHHAAAWLMLGEYTNAENSLHKALNLAMPDGLLLPFAENYGWLDGIPRKAFDYVPGGFADSVCSLAERLEAGICAIIDKLYSVCKRYGLSPREYETATLASKGFSYGEIADELHISLNTVKTHLKNVYRKTGASSRKVLRELL